MNDKNIHICVPILVLFYVRENCAFFKLLELVVSIK